MVGAFWALNTVLIPALPLTFRGDPEYLIHTWQTGDGLPENSATSLVQSPDGYLWFGTFNGLVRFDGVQFSVANPSNSPLPSEGIVNLCQDRRGWLWISTYRGMVIREGRMFRTLEAKDGWVGDVVRTFTERRNGDLLLTTFDGHVLEYSQGRLTALPPPPGDPGQGYFGQVDPEGYWWVVQNRFIGRWNGAAWETMISPPQSMAADRVACTGSRDGGLWLFLDGELRKYKGRSEAPPIMAPTVQGGIWSLYEDSSANVWICTYDHGLYRISPDQQVRHWTTTNGLAYNGVRAVFEDAESNLWVGTSGGGLQRFKPHRFQALGPEKGLTTPHVKSIWRDTSNGVWLATFGHGLFRWHEDALSPMPLSVAGNALTYLQTVLTDHHGRTWVGPYRGHLGVLDERGFHPIDANQFGSGVLALFEDSQRRMWIGGTKGVSVYETESLRLLREINSAAGARCFAEDSDGTIWLSNLEEVLRIDPSAASPVFDESHRPLRNIGCIKADPDGTVWLGSKWTGLLCRRSTNWFRIGPEQGLPAKGIYGIIEDGQGFFWMTSDQGVIRARRNDLLEVSQGAGSRLNAQLFNESDGLPGIEFAADSQPTCASDTKGRLWFATLKGAVMIEPERLKLNPRKPPVHIESLSYSLPNRRVRSGFGSKAILYPPFSEPIVLPPGSRNIVIQYIALSLTAPEKARYEVRLEGSEANWRDTGGARTAEFYELSANTYRFHVRAANNDNLWSETGASLALVVEPFLWQTWWFRASAVLALTSAGCAATWWRSRARHHHQLDELEHTRRRQLELAHVGRVATLGQLAATLAHELNQPLGAILSNAEAAEMLLGSPQPDLDQVRIILADIQRDDLRAGEVIHRMRQLLKRRELELTRLALSDLLEETVSLIRSDAAARKMSIEIQIEPALPPVCGDWIHLQQVLLNLMLNGMHAMSSQDPGKGHLVLRARRANDSTVECAVQDTGHGIPAEKLASIFEPFVTTKPEGLGMGLALSRTLIEAHGGRIWAENNLDGGATVRFTLRIS